MKGFACLFVLEIRDISLYEVLRLIAKRSWCHPFIYVLLRSAEFCAKTDFNFGAINFEHFFSLSFGGPFSVCDEFKKIGGGKRRSETFAVK